MPTPITSIESALPTIEHTIKFDPPLNLGKEVLDGVCFKVFQLIKAWGNTMDIKVDEEGVTFNSDAEMIDSQRSISLRGIDDIFSKAKVSNSTPNFTD